MRILEQLNKYDENLTLLHVKNIINEEIEKEKKEENRKKEEIKEKFNNSYIKIEELHDTYGELINIYHIKEITKIEKNTAWKPIFNWRGNKIMFYEKGFNFMKIKEDLTYFTFSEEDLINAQIINKSDYNLYLKKYKKLNKILKNIK
jgi:hypothetical protein